MNVFFLKIGNEFKLIIRKKIIKKDGISLLLAILIFLLFIIVAHYHCLYFPKIILSIQYVLKVNNN